MSDAAALRIAHAALATMSSPPGGASPPSKTRAAGALMRAVVDVLDASGRPEGREITRAVDAAMGALGPGGLEHLARGDVSAAAWTVAARVLAEGERRAMAIIADRFRKP